VWSPWALVCARSDASSSPPLLILPRHRPTDALLSVTPIAWTLARAAGAGPNSVVLESGCWCTQVSVVRDVERSGTGLGKGRVRARVRGWHSDTRGEGTSRSTQWGVAGAWGHAHRPCASCAHVAVSRDACALPHTLRGFCAEEWAVPSSSGSERSSRSCWRRSSPLRCSGHGMCGSPHELGRSAPQYSRSGARYPTIHTRARAECAAPSLVGSACLRTAHWHLRVWVLLLMRVGCCSGGCLLCVWCGGQCNARSRLYPVSDYRCGIVRFCLHVLLHCSIPIVASTPSGVLRMAYPGPFSALFQFQVEMTRWCGFEARPQPTSAGVCCGKSPRELGAKGGQDESSRWAAEGRCVARACSAMGRALPGVAAAHRKCIAILSSTGWCTRGCVLSVEAESVYCV
jgi:hypothetical protein